MPTARILKILAVLAAMVALGFMFLQTLVYEGVDFKGYEVLFGQSMFDVDPFGLGTIASARLPFSVYAAFGYALIVAGGLMALLSRRFTLWAIVAFVGAFVLLVTLPNTTRLVYTVLGIENTVDVDWSMGFGLIGSLIGTVIAGILLLPSLK